MHIDVPPPSRCLQCHQGPITDCPLHGEFSDYGRLQPRWLGHAITVGATVLVVLLIVRGLR